MDGYQQVPRRVATGYFGLIFFIVLSVVLVAGYVPVVLVLQQKSQDLELLNQKIATHIEEELRQKGNPLPVQQPMDGQTLRYGDEFFSQLKELALFGVDYSTLVNKVGWPRPTTIIDDINSRLAGHPNLKELVDYLESELQSTRARLEQRDEAFKEADADRKRRLEELEKAKADFATRVEALQTQMQKEGRDAQDKINDFHQKWQESSEERKKLWEQYVKMESDLRETLKRKDAVIDDLNAEVAMLRDELRREVVVIPTEAVGSVLNSDLVLRFAIIDRGKMDNMSEGQELLVYREAPMGRKVHIGKVVIVKTYDKTSRADIIEQNDANPIMPKDLLYMQPPAN